MHVSTDLYGDPDVSDLAQTIVDRLAALRQEHGGEAPRGAQLFAVCGVIARWVEAQE